ncbi:hypothetical protein C8R43DRAFT_240363 [Mycena crocata]|nr:hypothetical protein C8R43DRAFT_240363 [Mycena crocata]
MLLVSIVQLFVSFGLMFYHSHPGPGSALRLSPFLEKLESRARETRLKGSEFVARAEVANSLSVPAASSPHPIPPVAATSAATSAASSETSSASAATSSASSATPSASDSPSSAFLEPSIALPLAAASPPQSESTPTTPAQDSKASKPQPAKSRFTGWWVVYAVPVIVGFFWGVASMVMGGGPRTVAEFAELPPLVVIPVPDNGQAAVEEALQHAHTLPVQPLRAPSPPPPPPRIPSPHSTPAPPVAPPLALPTSAASPLEEPHPSGFLRRGAPPQARCPSPPPAPSSRLAPPTSPKEEHSVVTSVNLADWSSITPTPPTPPSGASMRSSELGLRPRKGKQAALPVTFGANLGELPQLVAMPAGQLEHAMDAVFDQVPGRAHTPPPPPSLPLRGSPPFAPLSHSPAVSNLARVFDSPPPPAAASLPEDSSVLVETSISLDSRFPVTPTPPPRFRRPAAPPPTIMENISSPASADAASSPPPTSSSTASSLEELLRPAPPPSPRRPAPPTASCMGLSELGEPRSSPRQYSEGISALPTLKAPVVRVAELEHVATVLQLLLPDPITGVRPVVVHSPPPSPSLSASVEAQLRGFRGSTQAQIRRYGRKDKKGMPNPSDADLAWAEEWGCHRIRLTHSTAEPHTSVVHGNSESGSGLQEHRLLQAEVGEGASPQVTEDVAPEEGIDDLVRLGAEEPAPTDLAEEDQVEEAEKQAEMDGGEEQAEEPSATSAGDASGSAVVVEPAVTPRRALADAEVALYAGKVPSTGEHRSAYEFACGRTITIATSPL